MWSAGVRVDIESDGKQLSYDDTFLFDASLTNHPSDRHVLPSEFSSKALVSDDRFYCLFILLIVAYHLLHTSILMQQRE